MNPKIRFALLGLLLAVVAAIVYGLASGSDGADATLPGGLSAKGRAVDVLRDSRSCAPCHPAIYAEWEESFHGRAFTEPEVRKLSENFKNKDCIPCHAPVPMIETGLGERVLARLDRRPEGVDCLSCHKGKDGFLGAHGATGSRTRWPDACDPVRAPEFISSMQLCFPCHNQHKTHDEWQASPAFAKGQDCNDCHMPTVPGEATIGSTTRREHRSHVFLGGHHPDFIRAAIRFEASVAKDEAFGARATVVVRNEGAGHNFPTDSRNRAVDVTWQALNPGGIEIGSGQAWRFRNPYITEIDKTNTQLPSGEEKRIEIDLPEGPGTAVLRLMYRHNPFEEDKDSVILYERRIDY